MAAKDYYLDETIKCICGHHVHARQADPPITCECSDIDHCLICPVEIAFNK